MQYGYSIGIPPGWTLDERDSTKVVIRSPGEISELFVIYLPNPGHTLYQLTDKTIDSRKSSGRNLFMLLSRSQVTLASGVPAARILYSWQRDPHYCVESTVVVLVLSSSQG